MNGPMMKPIKRGKKKKIHAVKIIFVMGLLSLLYFIFYIFIFCGVGSFVRLWVLNRKSSACFCFQA